MLREDLAAIKRLKLNKGGSAFDARAADLTELEQEMTQWIIAGWSADLIRQMAKWSWARRNDGPPWMNGITELEMANMIRSIRQKLEAWDLGEERRYVIE